MGACVTIDPGIRERGDASDRSRAARVYAGRRATIGAGPVRIMRTLPALAILPLLSVLTAQAAPVIGAAFAIGNASGATDKAPRVAYDYGTDRYCVVWTADNGTAPANIYAQLVVGGTPIGAAIVVSANARVGKRPAIANINATDRFLIAWSEISGSGLTLTLRVKARSVDAGTGALSPIVDVGSFMNTAGDPLVDLEVDIGGDRRTGFLGTAQDALVVWSEERLLSATLRCRHVQVPSTGTPVPGTTTVLQAGGAIGTPRVTRHCGVNGRWGVVWPSGSGPLMGQPNVRLGVVDSLGLCSSHTLATMTSSVTNPSCATIDGVSFAAAWSASSLVHVMPFTVTGACPGTLGAGAIVTPFTTPGWLTEPVIDFAAGKYALACRHRVDGSATTYRVLVKNLDPSTCASCGVEWFAETSGASQEAPAICAKRSGSGSADDQAIVVWSNGTIRGRRFEASTSSLPVGMGGGCGAFGFNDFATYDGHCVLGNSTFSLSLASPTSPIVALVIGFTSAPLACGPCTVVPSIDVILPGVSPTVIPIPCQASLIGGELWTQWVQSRVSGCPLAPDLSTSNTLRFTIAE